MRLLLSLLVAAILGMEALSQLVSMHITSEEREFLEPLFLCCASSSPGNNRIHCIEPYTGAMRRIGIRLLAGAFVGPEESFFFVHLLRCSRMSITAGRNRCIRDVFSMYADSQVNVHALVLLAPRFGYETAASPVSANLKRNLHDSLEFQLSGVVVPLNESLAVDEVRFYEPLMTCSAVYGDNDARQACMHGYLRRWERMGVIVPLGRRLARDENLLLTSLLHCESLPEASVPQAVCIGDRIEKAGVWSARSLVDAELAARIRNASAGDGSSLKSYRDAERR